MPSSIELGVGLPVTSVGIAFVAGSLLLATRASATDLVFGWEAPDACPGRDGVVARIVALTGGQLPKGTPDLSFEAEVQELADGSWSLSVVRRSGGERNARTLRGESCAAVAEAASVVVALAIREERAKQPATAPALLPAPALRPAPRPATAPQLAAAPTPRVAAAPVASRISASRAWLRLEAGVDRSLLPELASLFSLAGGMPIADRYRFETVTVVLPAQTMAVGSATATDSGAPVRTSVWLVSQGLRGCFVVGRTTLSPMGCAVLEAGMLQAHSAGAGTPNVGTALWTAAGMRLGLGARVGGPARLGIAAEVVQPLLIHSLRFGGREVYRLDSAAQRGWIGLELELP